MYPVREGPVMMIVSVGGACGWGVLRWPARLRGHLDILALMTLGLTRNRRVFNLCKISEVASVMAAANRSGGKGHLVGDLAADYPQRAHERDPVWVELDRLGGTVDQRTDGVVNQQMCVDLLDDHLR